MSPLCPECAGRVADPRTEYVERCPAHPQTIPGLDDAAVSFDLVGAPEAVQQRAVCAVVHRTRGATSPA